MGSVAGDRSASLYGLTSLSETWRVFRIDTADPDVERRGRALIMVLLTLTTLNILIALAALFTAPLSASTQASSRSRG